MPPAAFMPSSVITIQYAVTNSPAPGGQVDFTATVTASGAVDEVALHFTTEGNVVLTTPLDQVLTDLAPGEQVVLTGTLDITTNGTGSLTATAEWTYQTNCGEKTDFAGHFPFYVLDDGTTVYTGETDIINVQGARIVDLYNRGLITEEEAQAQANALVGSEKPYTGRAESGPPGRQPVTINGRVRWADVNGNLHDGRSLQVMLIGTLHIYALTNTGADGRYTATFVPDALPGQPDFVQVQVYAQNPAGHVRNPFLIILGGTYYMFTNLVQVFHGQTYNDVDLIANNNNVRESAFSIVDGLLEGASYVNTMSGSAPGSVGVNWPDSGSAFLLVTITLMNGKAHSWDILLHEYGHYVAIGRGWHAWDCPTYPGGCTHIFTDDQTIAHGKNGGANLGWQEGLVTYMGLAAQAVSGTSALGVAFAGDDGRYHDFVSGGAGCNPPAAPCNVLQNWWFNASMETNNDPVSATGEGAEINVMRLLWDLADGGAEDGDEIALGHAGVWNRLVAGGSYSRLSHFWPTLTAGLSDQDKLKYGALLELNQIAPRHTAPAKDVVLADPGTPPRFEWDALSKLNRFRVKFYDEAYTQVFESPEQAAIGAAGNYQAQPWTPTQNEWDTILDAAPTGVMYWAIEARNVDAPETGPYLSGAWKLKAGARRIAFVIDDTGSMYDEIDQVKTQILTFLNRFNPTTNTTEFQLTTFKDDVTVRPATADLATIRAQIQALQATSGGDCREASGEALNQATGALQAGDRVFFATDADPHPGFDLNALIAGLQQRKVRVNVLLSGTCGKSLGGGRGGSPNDPLAPPPEAPPDRDLTDLGVSAFSALAEATGGVFAFVPEVEQAGTGSQRYGNILSNLLDAFVEPHIVKALPAQVRRAATARVTVQGQDTNFQAGASVVFSSPQVLVTNVQAVSPTELTALVVVLPGAPLGFVDATVSTPLALGVEEVVVGQGVLEVVDVSTLPELVSITPPVVAQGQTVTVEIRGAHTHFSPSSVLDLGLGVTMLQVHDVPCPNTLLATVTVDEKTDVDLRTVTVTSGNQVATSTLNEFFRVRAASPQAMLSLDPPEGPVGETLLVKITLDGLTVTPEEIGQIQVAFEPGDVAVTRLEVCAADRLGVTVMIAGGAALGFRMVTVTAPGGSAVGTAVFTVVAAGRDCNSNGHADDSDIAAGTSSDCDSNGIPDECQSDCNANGTPDACDIARGSSWDCNCNAWPDECEVLPVLDCNSNGTPDDCEVGMHDCNSNGVPDECDLAAGMGGDCNSNGVPDECEPDCNTNGVADACDLRMGTSPDCDSNGVPDECEEDCNTNGIPDTCDIATGLGHDCNTNGALDECEVLVPGAWYVVEPGWGDPPRLFTVRPPSAVLTLVGYLDAEVTNIVGLAVHPLTGQFYGIVQKYDPWESRRLLARLDPRTAHVIIIDWLSRYLADIAFRSDGRLYGITGNNDSTPGEIVLVNVSDASITPTGIVRGTGGGHSIAFQPVTNRLYHAGTPILEKINVDTAQVSVVTTAMPDDFQALAFDPSGTPLWGYSWGELYAIAPDTGAATYVDETRETITGMVYLPGVDCNSNGIPDTCDLAAGNGTDCNHNHVPDACDLANGASVDCNTNGVPDECDIAAGSAADCNHNVILDACEADCNANGHPDDCDLTVGTSPDCNSNALPDECELTGGSSNDINSNAIPDECEPDCNGNGTPDSWDLTVGLSIDCQSNGIPDECEPDCNTNAVADGCDVAAGTSPDCNANGRPDECELVASCSGAVDIPGFYSGAWNYPLSTYYHDARTTSIYPAWEFGCTGGSITALRYYVTTVPGQTMNNFTIRMRHTTRASYPTAAFENEGWTVVYQANHTVASTGWHTFTFTRSFEWKGPDNLEVDVSFNNNFYTSDGVVYYYQGGYGRTKYYRCDSCPCGGSDPLTWTCTGNLTTNVPRVEFVIEPTGSGDCNTNAVPDDCDIAAGSSLDCNTNGSPDECEPDCNTNGVADPCDLSSGFSRDCNINGIPDECEPDTDGDGVIDDCDSCSDTPPGVPVYADGCPLGDLDLDGDVDLADLALFVNCLSGPDLTTPPPGCDPFVFARADLREDADVDLADFGVFQEVFPGP